MKVAVTGATGFIGRRVVELLASNTDCDIVAASRSAPTFFPSSVRCEAIDLLSAGATADFIARHRPTHVVHLAWFTTPGRFWAARENLDWTAASLTLLRAFLDCGGSRAVLAGTCAEYDWTGDGTLSEWTPTNPATLYGGCKDVLRRAVGAANEHLSASCAWGRVFWLYGPRQAPGRLVSDVAASLARGSAVEVGEGQEVRDFLHVDDVAGAFVAALKSAYRGPFNIGSGQAVKVRDIIETLADLAGRPELVRFGARPTPSNQPPLLVADVSALTGDIGWKQSIPLRTGLQSTYDWWISEITASAAK